MPFPYKRILCPVDFDQFSALALKEAASLALGGGATVHLLHVVQINPSLDEGATGGLAVGGKLSIPDRGGAEGTRTDAERDPFRD